MPRLDPYQSQVKLNGTRDVQANENMFGGQTARAAEQVGNQLDRTGDVVAQVDDAKSRFRAANYMAGADLDWRAQMIQAQTDPEFAKKYGEDGSLFADSFKEKFEQYASDQIQNADPRDRKYIEQGMYNLGESLMGSAIEFQAKVGADFAGDTLKKSINNGSISARLSPEQYTSILANATLAVSTAPHIDPTVRSKYAEAATKDITTGAALGRLEKGGVAAAQQIKSGKMVFMALDAEGKPVKKTLAELVDADTFDTLTNQADVVIRKAESEAAQARSDMKSDIDMQIEMAETPDDFMKVSKLISDNAGVFKHKELNEMRVKLYKQSKSIRDDYESVDRGNAFASGNAYLNPAMNDSVKDFNNYYNKRVAPALSSMEPNERNTYLTNMVATAKVIPDALKGDIQTASRSNDPKLIASTADFIDRLRMTNPHLIQDIDQKDLARVDMVNSKMASGLTADKAMEQVDAALDVSNKAVFDKRTEELKDAKIDYQSLAMKNFNAPWYVKALPGDSGSVEDTNSEFATRQAAQITTEYKAAYETQYKLTGDVTAAQKYANSVVAGTYGVSTINGKNQLMRHPPEKYFGIDNVDNDWMRKQVEEEAIAVLKNTLQDGDHPIKAKDVIIVPAPYVTPRTAKEGRPLYKMMALTPDGGYTDLLGPNKFFTFDKQKKIGELVDDAKKEASE